MATGITDNSKRWLILILAVTVILGFYGLSRGDTVNDEVFMSFRGIGLMDFNEAAEQTTPWEWFDPSASSGQVRGIPWWAKISMHDHPLLVPLVQNLFMKVFGESNFGFRLPSALLGIGAVYLVYLIGARLFSNNAGLISSALFGVTLNHIYISRTGMQEAYVIFFLLLGSYLFLKSLKEEKYLIWTGAVIGLGALAKYNTLILVPIFLTYLLIFRRDYFKNKKFWLGAGLAVLIFSPVIIYNTMLYRAVGHFDFQFSFILGQQPKEWPVAPGKDIGTLAGRISDFIPKLIATNSWLFLALAGISVLGFIGSLFRRPKEIFNQYALLLIIIFWLLALLMLIGPSYRFLTMLTPFLALGIGAQLGALSRQSYSNVLKNIRIGKIFYILLSMLLIWEIFYSINNQIAYYPIGSTPWLASKVRFENYNWGYNELGRWLEKELKGKMPGLTFDPRYKFLDDLRERALDRGLAEGLQPYPALIIYHGNFDLAAKLWVLDRLHIYHAWPVISLEAYYDYLQQNGFDYYERAGFKNVYFILQNNIVPAPESGALMRGEVTGIKNPRGEEVFKIYQFNL
ncbi:MAG: glycosyltransferase family 39 protein [bacterium]|nr:glycosyltransferase family 39 protein [bacterium]